MRWKTKRKKPTPPPPKPKVVVGKKGPQLGDTREIVWFAYSPTEVGEMTVWMEKYIEVQEFKQVTKYRKERKSWAKYIQVEDGWGVPVSQSEIERKQPEMFKDVPYQENVWRRKELKLKD